MRSWGFTPCRLAHPLPDIKPYSLINISKGSIYTQSQKHGWTYQGLWLSMCRATVGSQSGLSGVFALHCVPRFDLNWDISVLRGDGTVTSCYNACLCIRQGIRACWWRRYWVGGIMEMSTLFTDICVCENSGMNLAQTSGWLWGPGWWIIQRCCTVAW